MLAFDLFTRLEDRPQEDGVVVLNGATWADYERMLEMRGDHSAPRFTYAEGVLEIMSPSRNHEAIKSLIGCLVEVYCMEHDIEFETLGSWTIEKKRLKRAVEPDECYLFGGGSRAARPDLAIEVVWTSGRIDKLDIYEKLGVAEIWYWREGKIQAYSLGKRGYRATAKSKALPGIDLEELTRFIDRPTTSAAMREYRAALRTRARSRR